MGSRFKLLITTDITSGVWNYTITLCEALLQQINAEIILVSFGGKPNNFQEEQIKNLNIQCLYTEYPLEWMDNCITDPSCLAEANKFLTKIINDFNPNIIHLNQFSCSTIKADCPIVLVCHSDILTWIKWVENHGKDYPCPKYLYKYRELVKNGLGNADVVVTPTRFVAEELVRSYDLRNKIKIIHHGISEEPSIEMSDEPTLITVGRLWDKAKNLNLLLKIASKLPENIKIRLVGEGPIDRVLSKRIEYLGNLSSSQLQEVYRSSSIYLALSSYEPFGLPLVEAAYGNCAIVANDIPSFRELWGDCACIFERNNVNSLIRCINNLIENDRILKFTAKNCQAKALSSFNSKRMVLEYINLYKCILQKSMSKVQKTNSTSEAQVS